MAERQPKKPKSGSRTRDDAQASYTRNRKQSSIAGAQKSLEVEKKIHASQELEELGRATASGKETHKG